MNYGRGITYESLIFDLLICQNEIRKFYCQAMWLYVR
jgi:hypothetical protein